MKCIDCSNEDTRLLVEDIIKYLAKGVEIANSLGIRNLLYNEGYVDLMIASALKHKYVVNTQGPDALDEEGNPTEYKCIVKRDNNYSGSFQFHWLSANKISKYKECKYFYFAWRDCFVIEKIIRVKSSFLMPFIEKNAGIDGSIEGHKSFSAKYIEDLVDKDSNASLVYKVGS
jgi:hypothetical protein